MNFLAWFLNVLGVAICTDITPAVKSESPVEGTVIAQIQEAHGEHGRAWRSISLHKFKEGYALGLHRNVGAASEIDYSAGIVPFEDSNNAVFNVDSVPVLDQGQYGTCVTFSTTGALDAVLNAGDGISQQCTLSLTVATGNSLWDGAYYSSEVIDPLKKYGVVRQNKCNGVNYASPKQKLSLSQYAKLVDPALSLSNIQYKYLPAIQLSDVQSAINNGHYVTVGMGLMNNGDAISVQGFDVVIYNQRQVGGLWACQQSSSKTNYCGTPKAGHEVIILGYDDSQQLVQIRNSWGANVGDGGDFYMSYAFFNAMVMDGTEIWQNN